MINSITNVWLGLPPASRSWCENSPKRAQSLGENVLADARSSRSTLQSLETDQRPVGEHSRPGWGRRSGGLL